MPTDDPRLERALQDAAPAVDAADAAGVLARVAHRRVIRRRHHRLALGALTIVVLLVVGTVTLFVTRDDDTTPPVDVAVPGAQLQARIVRGGGSVAGDAGEVVVPTRVALDADPHLLRPPLLAGATALSAASDDPGPPGVAGSHVVRVDRNRVVDIVDFKARVLSIAEGEGARWALTQNLRPTGGRVPDSFLKRIPLRGEPTSEQLPLDADPVGPIAAVGGAVWVPVRAGVLQFATDGRFVRHIPLADADARWVAQVNKLAYVTDEAALRGLDPSGTTTDTISFGSEIMGLASARFDGRVLLPAGDGGVEHARVARASTATPLEITAVLPVGFRATGLAASTTRIWATGTVDGAPAIALLGDRGVRATVVLENARGGAALAWTDSRTVTAVWGGSLYEIALP